MINTDRIVPITAVDLISMYGLILKQNETDLKVVASNTVEGDFVVTENGKLLANEPVKTVDFASGATNVGLYFVAGYDYTGFTVEGEAAVVDGDEVLNDGRTLYLAILAGGAITIEKVGF